MTPRARATLQLIAGVTAFSVVLGMGAGIVIGRGVDFNSLGRGGLTGLSIGLPLAVFEWMVAATELGGRLRRLRLAPLLAVRTAVYAAIIVFGVWVGRAAMPWTLIGTVGEGAEVFGLDIDFLQSVIAGLLVGFLINLGLALRRLLGPGVLLRFMSGRYHHPVREERAILFLDLAGSTAIAERIGDTRFLDLLNAVFYDVSDAIQATRGEIYKYVGDEVIVTWSRAAAADGRAIACVAEVAARMAERAEHYRETFGVAPWFRAGLHLGPVVVGEFGDIRQEIALLGDSINTAARIEEACRAHDARALASQALVDAGTLPAGVSAQPLGPVALRGKAEPVALVRLDVSAAPG